MGFRRAIGFDDAAAGECSPAWAEGIGHALATRHAEAQAAELPKRAFRLLQQPPIDGGYTEHHGRTIPEHHLDNGGGIGPVGIERDPHPERERPHHRSEEHTSELQSLMRISYAVFCLKKK